MIVSHCAPTLAAIKTGSLFACTFEQKSRMIRDIAEFNRRYAEKGIRLIPVRFSADRVLMLLYRPERLRSDLGNSQAKQILSRYGYPSDDPMRCVARLVRRFGESGEFPHEVGLFIGYPSEDVAGFIENKAKDFKLVGTWKVYGDAENAKRTFARYKKCTETYRRLLRAGVGLQQLVV